MICMTLLFAMSIAIARGLSDDDMQTPFVFANDPVQRAICREFESADTCEADDSCSWNVFQGKCNEHGHQPVFYTCDACGILPTTTTTPVPSTCDTSYIWPTEKYNSPNDYELTGGSSMACAGSAEDSRCGGGTFRNGVQNEVSYAKVKESLSNPIGTYKRLQVTWRFAQGYCSQLGVGQAARIEFLLNDQLAWSTDWPGQGIDMATEDISGDGGCGGDGWRGASYSSPRTFTVDVSGMDSELEVKWKMTTFDRNLHMIVDSIGMCTS